MSADQKGDVPIGTAVNAASESGEGPAPAGSAAREEARNRDDDMALGPPLPAALKSRIWHDLEDSDDEMELGPPPPMEPGDDMDLGPPLPPLAAPDAPALPLAGRDHSRGTQIASFYSPVSTMSSRASL